jgi:hypothetical protein
MSMTCAVTILSSVQPYPKMRIARPVAALSINALASIVLTGVRDGRVPANE